jgi:Plasmid pRiA4b ORF-3-like protein
MRVDAAISADELREAARLARDCAIAGRALALARWIGSGRRQVTAGQVLRRADLSDAGVVLGVNVPPRPRTMSDVKDLHRPWCVAVATGLLSVRDGWVTAGPVLAAWPPNDADLLRDWLVGLRAVCAAESYPQDESSVEMLLLALLTVLGGDDRSRGLYERMISVLDKLNAMLGQNSWGAWQAAARYYDLESERPIAGLIEMLAGFGAISGGVRNPALTPLGRWARKQLHDGLALPAASDLPAQELITEAARFADWDERDRVARDWLAARGPVEAALEMLKVAEDMGPFPRTVAVGLIRKLVAAAWPAWQRAAEWPCVGPHAREVLTFATDAKVSDADCRWLAAEEAAAALEEHGPDEALTRIWQGMPGDDLEEKLAAAKATEHPDAVGLVRAVEEFTASGAPRSIDQVAVLKVVLAGFRPPVWRRIQVPVIASLGTLHWVIRDLFGWDGDHLHVFEVGKKRYGCVDMSPEETADADTITMNGAFAAAGGKIEYTYDLGACWRHEITLEKTIPREQGKTYPICVAFKGDSPVEYWSEEDPESPEPFDIAEVNETLARLGE